MQPSVRSIDDIDAVVEPVHWDFEQEHRESIARFWQETISKQPRLFDGRILLQHQWHVEGNVYHARYTFVQYSAFLAWRHFGFPGSPMRNGFAMAALRSSDGAFLLGRMAAHTANPGKIFFAAGTPDQSDVVGEKVDLAGSVLRELAEETGLREEDVVVSRLWTLVEDGPRAAFMRPVSISGGAKDARALILSRMATSADDELEDIVIVRGRADIDRVNMPGYMIAYLESELPD